MGSEVHRLLAADRERRPLVDPGSFLVARGRDPVLRARAAATSVLTCQGRHSFMDADRTHKTTESEMKDHYSKSSSQSVNMFVLVP